LEFLSGQVTGQNLSTRTWSASGHMQCYGHGCQFKSARFLEEFWFISLL